MNKRDLFDKLPSKSEIPNMIYAGIGSRETPIDIQREMTLIATWLESRGYTLRSGGAEGADLAFEAGVKNKKEIFKRIAATDLTRAIAREIHPKPEALKIYTLDLMARNTNQIFGKDLNLPVDFVITWTRDGMTKYTERSIKTGGTGQAIEMASRKGIPVINMKDTNWMAKLKNLL